MNRAFLLLFWAGCAKTPLDTSVEDSSCLLQVWYADVDDDAHGDPNQPIEACIAPQGTAVVGDDCDDLDPNVSPGTPEIPGDGIDQDCTGGDTCYWDADGDGFGAEPADAPSCDTPGYASTPGDCDDTRASVHPAQPETCDGLDDDCDGQIDEAGSWLFRDRDHDGFGDPGAPVEGCTATGGLTEDHTDCDDTAATAHPGGRERCDDGADNDCDGTIDEEFTGWPDLDGDGYGAEGRERTTCEEDPTLVDRGGDCDDARATVHAGAEEIEADGVDQDCDGGDLCYEDRDHDGFGAETTLPSTDLDCLDLGESPSSTDCDDTLAAVNPDADETPADGRDQDCDGRERCYRDLDDDGLGVGPVTSEDLDCDGPDVAPTGGDCDDADPTIGGVEPYWADGDGDGYGDPTHRVESCDPLEDYVANDLDCDDRRSWVHPGAHEVCDDEIDQDCDGIDPECD